MAPQMQELTEGRLTLADLIDAYISFVLQQSDPSSTNRFIGTLQQKLSSATDPQQAQNLSSLIRALMADSPEMRRQEIVKLMQVFANKSAGRQVNIQFQPLQRPITAAVQFQEMLNVLLMAHLAKYGTFMANNVMGSLIQLRNAVQQFFNNPYANQGPLLERLQAIPLMHDLPAVSERLYTLLVNPTPTPASQFSYKREVLGMLNEAIQNVMDATLPMPTPPAEAAATMGSRLSNIYSLFRSQPSQPPAPAPQSPVPASAPAQVPQTEFDMGSLQASLPA